MTTCWIIPIIVGLISALLGYLLGRAGKQRVIDEWEAKYNATQERLAECGRKVSLLENDISNAKQSESKARQSYNELVGRFDLLQHEWDENRTEIQNLKDENDQLKVRLADASNVQSGGGSDVPIPLVNQKIPQLVFDAAAARELLGKSIKENDLTVVEGIGPKIRDLFHEQGVSTWYALSQCSVERCEEILRTGGDRFNQHIPVTWPRQARLAFEGKWSELKAWQDELDGGK